MCKIAPGPRCASHTRKNLRKARTRVAHALNDVRESSRLYDEVATNPEARNAQLLAARARMEKSLESLRSAEVEQEEAQKAFDSTPTGQEELQDRINAAQELGDNDEVASLSARLAEAKETREAQMNANRILSTGENRLRRLTDTDKQTLTTLESEAETARTQLTEAEAKVRQASVNLARTRQDLEKVQTSTNNAMAEVKTAHEAIATRVKQAYLDAGVSPSRADHYTADTMHSVQDGWEYLSEDSADRAPRFNDDFVVKVKGFEHPDNLATAAAEDALANDPEFAQMRQEASRSHAAYAASLTPLKEAKAAHKETDKAMSEASAEYSTHRVAYVSATKTLDVAKATIASGMREGEYYEVDKDRFISSAYRNPDGTTNAHVLIKHPKRAPMYLPVSEISRDKGGAFLRLNTGDKVYAAEMSARSLRLVRPAEGAAHLFNRSR